MWRTLESRTRFCRQLIIWPNANHLTARVSWQSDAQRQKGRSDNPPRPNLYNRWLPHFYLIYLASLLLNCLSMVYPISMFMALSLAPSLLPRTILMDSELISSLPVSSLIHRLQCILSAKKKKYLVKKLLI